MEDDDLIAAERSETARLEARATEMRAVRAESERMWATQRSQLAHERIEFQRSLRWHVCQAWRLRHRGAWQYAGGAAHVCNQTAKCIIERLHARYYAATNHLCVRGVCPCDRAEHADWARATHTGAFDAIDDTYVCARTGLGHVCSSPWSVGSCVSVGAVDQYSEGRVCLVSGRVGRVFYEDVRATATRAYDADRADREQGACIGAAASARYDVNASCSMAAVRNSALVNAAENRTMFEALRRRRHREQPALDYYVAVATLRVALVLSKERFARDAETNRANTVKARQHAATNRRRARLCALETVVELMAWRSNRPATPMLTVSDPLRGEIVETYARKCVLQWSVIMLRTEAGRRNGNKLFPFFDFCVACLYLFKSGVTVADAAGEHVTIIEPDAFLGHFLPKEIGLEAREATRFSSACKLTDMLQNARDALQAAVRTEGVGHERLRASAMALEQIPATLLKRAVNVGRQPRAAAPSRAKRQSKSRGVLYSAKASRKRAKT